MSEGQDLLLNSNQFPRLNASSQQDGTVGSIPKLFDGCVSIHGVPAAAGRTLISGLRRFCPALVAGLPRM